MSIHLSFPLRNSSCLHAYNVISPFDTLTTTEVMEYKQMQSAYLLLPGYQAKSMIDKRPCIAICYLASLPGLWLFGISIHLCLKAVGRGLAPAACDGTKRTAGASPRPTAFSRLSIIIPFRNFSYYRSTIYLPCLATNRKRLATLKQVFCLIPRKRQLRLKRLR